VDIATTQVSKNDAILSSLSPDCPDWTQLGPNIRDSAIRAAAEANKIAARQREDSWSSGFNRRTFLKGGLGVGVAALGSQLVTSRVAYAEPGVATNGTLVVLFLRGGMDGLSMLVPAGNNADLVKNRPGVGVQGNAKNPLIALDTPRGFALHPAMSPLKPLITAGKVAAVPAVSTPDLSRSHFQAQDTLERGSSGAGSLTSGWLDRVLEASGPGTTFRSVAVGGLLPRSLMGTSQSMAMYDLDQVKLNVPDTMSAQTTDALESLYTGVDHPISMQTVLAVEALATVKSITGPDAVPSTVTYPDGNLGDALSSLATMIKAHIGVKVACIDVGGWDTHTGMGNVDGGDMKTHLGDLATALAAFTSDLAGDLDSTTIVTMSEFGRRVEQNASGGTDHGHGGAVLVLGGGVVPGVHGVWNGLGDNVLDQGDVPGLNDYRDVLTEVVTKRVGISVGAMAPVFPGWHATPLGIMA
jgi:uncharacterized protein (DUF1501 family)